MKRLRLCLIVALALLLVTVSVAGASGNPNPGVLPPNSRVQERTLGEWTALYWEYVLTIPTWQSPFFGNVGTGCLYERIGNVALIAADWNRPLVTCEVPAGTMLQFMVVGTECSTLEAPPFYGGNEEELRACAQSIALDDLQASIDGVPLENLSQYVYTSPLYEFTMPEDNIFGVPAGTTGQSVGHAFYVALAPLSAGTHMLHFYGYIPDFDFPSEFNFELTVAPGR